MKKRYSKLFAYFYAAFVNGCVLYPLCLIMQIALPSSGKSKMIITFALWTVICVVLTVLMSKKLVRNVPEGEKFGVCIRAWWLGVRISFKIELCLTLILIPIGMGMHTSISDADIYTPHWYDERGKVKVNGVECKVGRSGEYIYYGSQWVKVNRAQNGDPYITQNGENIWLE